MKKNHYIWKEINLYEKSPICMEKDRYIYEKKP